jgi:uncharacterized membrane protein
MFFRKKDGNQRKGRLRGNLHSISLLQSQEPPMRATMNFVKSRGKIFLGLAVVLWFATGAAIFSRVQLIFDYATLPLVPPEYEILACSTPALTALALLLVFVARPLFWRHTSNTGRNNVNHAQASSTHDRRVAACWWAASLPLALIGLRVIQVGVPPPHWWELVWFAGWTGMGVRGLFADRDIPISLAEHPRLWHFLLSIAVVGCGGWWFLQSTEYYADYLLGFNDFGHFTQRISNTVQGNGFLLESPVLPPFWDHFNPGLALLVPVWFLIPSMEMIFAIQAACLAGSAWLVFAIARARGQSPLVAFGWGCAWLLFPSIGQMNLAYTYGWHPITLAIPCLLAAYLAVCRNRVGIAVFWTLIALAFEEGVFVVIACFAIVQAIRIWFTGGQRQVCIGWSVVAIGALVGFVLVYQFSGLAPFQTGRFAKLGNNAFEIMASPVLRPEIFWGLIFRPRNAAFACLWLVPWIVAATHAWLWSVLAVLPPLFVLMIWEHMPAQSLAFQYTSCLIPVLFLGVLEPSGNARSQHGRAFGMLAVVWILSISIGQMPWSHDSLVDVKAGTYGADSRWNRSHAAEDWDWITRRIASIKRREDSSFGKQLPAWSELRVLATGRIAAHFVGVGDLETVGQFWQRFDALKELDSSRSSPILRYDILLLDFRESFQQTPDETERIYQEAIRYGWKLRERRYDFAILWR